MVSLTLTLLAAAPKTAVLTAVTAVSTNSTDTTRFIVVQR